MSFKGGVAGISADRQQRIEGYVDVNFSDLTSGDDYAVFWLPAGATDITGNVVPIVAFNSETSDVLDVGNESSENAYKNDLNIAATTAGALTGLPLTVANGFWVTVRWTGVGNAPTAGQFRIFFTYIMEERGQFSHGASRYGLSD
jgi:hypothetical protein